MRVWQRRALMAVYATLNKVPSGFGGSASTTPRALMNAARIRDAVLPKCQRVIESLAFSDDRAEVEAEVREMAEALESIEAELDRGK